MVVPLLFAELGLAGLEVTDTAFLGQIGATALAAIGMAETILEFAIAPVVGFMEAMQIVVARRIGQLQEHDIAPTFDRALRVVGIASLVIACVLRFGSEAFAQAIITPSAVAAALVHFFRYGAIGFVFLALNLTYSSLYVGLGRTGILVRSTLILVGVNVLLSYALVLGHFGSPRLGIEGAGIAFAVAEALTLAFFAWRAGRQLNVGRGSWLPARIVGGISTKRLAGLAWPISGQVLTEALRWLGFFFIVDQIGRDALAESSIIFACYALLLVPTDACAEAIYSVVSNMIGRGQALQVPTVVRRITGAAYGITAPFLVFLAVAPATALSIFTNEYTTLHGAVPPLRLLALLMLIVIPGDTWLASVFGTGDTRFGSTVELVGSVVMLVGAYTVGIALRADLLYVWATLGAAALISFAMCRARVHGGHWHDLP